MDLQSFCLALRLPYLTDAKWLGIDTEYSLHLSGYEVPRYLSLNLKERCDGQNSRTHGDTTQGFAVRYLTYEPLRGAIEGQLT